MDLLRSRVPPARRDAVRFEIRVESRTHLPPEHHEVRRVARRCAHRRVGCALKLRKKRGPVVSARVDVGAQRFHQHAIRALRRSVRLRVEGRAALQLGAETFPQAFPEMRCEPRIPVADDRARDSENGQPALIQRAEHLLRRRALPQRNVHHVAREFVDDHQRVCIAARRARERAHEIHADDIARALRRRDREWQPLPPALVRLPSLTHFAAVCVPLCVFRHLRPPNARFEPFVHARAAAVSALERVVRPAQHPRAQRCVLRYHELAAARDAEVAVE